MQILYIQRLVVACSAPNNSEKRLPWVDSKYALIFTRLHQTGRTRTTDITANSRHHTPTFHLPSLASFYMDVPAANWFHTTRARLIKLFIQVEVCVVFPVTTSKSPTVFISHLPATVATQNYPTPSTFVTENFKQSLVRCTANAPQASYNLSPGSGIERRSCSSSRCQLAQKRPKQVWLGDRVSRESFFYTVLFFGEIGGRDFLVCGISR